MGNFKFHSTDRIEGTEALLKLNSQLLSEVQTLKARLDVQENILLEIRKQSYSPAPTQQFELIRGIKGLAKFLSISDVKAQEIKNSGKIPFYQIDRVVLFEPQKVIAALDKHYKH